MKTSSSPRPRSKEIRPITASAAWVLLSSAAREVGITERIIRKQNLPTRRFGNADYINPSDLNAWILGR